MRPVILFTVRIALQHVKFKKEQPRITALWSQEGHDLQSQLSQKSKEICLKMSPTFVAVTFWSWAAAMELKDGGVFTCEICLPLPRQGGPTADRKEGPCSKTCKSSPVSAQGLSHGHHCQRKAGGSYEDGETQQKPCCFNFSRSWRCHNQESQIVCESRHTR